MHELPHELPNNLRLKEISRKSLKRLDLKASTQLSTQELNFDAFQ